MVRDPPPGRILGGPGTADAPRVSPGETLVVTLGGVGTIPPPPAPPVVRRSSGSRPLSGAVASHVELGWSTTDGTATAGADYTAVSGGRTSSPAGRSPGPVTTLAYEVAEGDEEFTVTLTPPRASCCRPA